ncbi:ABC transporter permease [Lactiplantibacillus sp. WILCCON 0030]|uniref:ABC transporter permease n=1 Tax=Lactiplantibacillus brownii TaxID=3069269 RepID=A0ABU1A8L1_9LACO|nr:ABC transporter permease [Lactiplantibacillus brownii]MDQ7937298.1 ABC transporter permease [Lactiplantibacillus brownii]
MKTVLAQLKFDSRRLILRNFSFQFFSILMPAGFYLLFTKVMVSGTASERFSLQYMASMIVYSGTINGLFGIAAILMHDREKGLLQWYQLTPSGVQPYYLSMGFWSMAMNGIAIMVLGTLAVVVNQVSLTGSQWLAVAGVALIGQLPTLLLGVLISFINRPETLSVVSNLITFPMAIISGLWWPMSMLPSWLQPIGKLMPTYFVNNWLGAVATHATLETTNVIGVGAWIGILLILVIGTTRQLLKRGDGIVKA